MPFCGPGLKAVADPDALLPAPPIVSHNPVTVYGPGGCQAGQPE
jgi:hypothetical protein